MYVFKKLLAKYKKLTGKDYESDGKDHDCLNYKEYSEVESKIKHVNKTYKNKSDERKIQK